MKTIAFILALLFVTFYQPITQPCLPDGIILSNQEQVISIKSDFPNCTEIEGRDQTNDMEAYGGPFREMIADYRVGVEDQKVKYPEEADLFILPNPFSGAARVKTTNTEYQMMNLEVLNVSGMKVQDLINNEIPAGTYEIEIDSSDIRARGYCCVLSTKHGKRTTKLIKL